MKKKEALKLVEKVINKEETIEILNEAISHHERMKNSYFWSSPRVASKRRSYEEKNSFSYKIDMVNGYIDIEQKVQCSCANIYYKMSIDLVIDDEYVQGSLNLRFLKQLQDGIESTKFETIT